MIRSTKQGGRLHQQATSGRENFGRSPRPSTIPHLEGISMKIIEREITVEGMGYHGMSIVLRRLRTGYGVYYYIHCEDRYSEAMTTTDEAEAREYFRREVKTARIKQAIIN